MTLELVKIGQEVVYIPNNLLIGPTSEIIKEENLGVVTSKNETYVFVRYKGNTGSQATDPKDLFPLANRPDLIDKLNNVEP